MSSSSSDSIWWNLLAPKLVYHYIFYFNHVRNSSIDVILNIICGKIASTLVMGWARRGVSVKLSTFYKCHPHLLLVYQTVRHYFKCLKINYPRLKWYQMAIFLNQIPFIHNRHYNKKSEVQESLSNSINRIALRLLNQGRIRRQYQ